MESIVQLIEKIHLDQQVYTFCKIQLLSHEEIANFKSSRDWRLELKINIEYDLAYDKLYIGQWNKVPEEFRRMFQVLSFLKSFSTVINNKDFDKNQFLKALQVLDLAIIIGAGLDESHLLTEFAHLLHELIVERHPPELIESADAPEQSSCQCDIDVVSRPTEEKFWTKYFNFHHPVKLTDCINSWPAMSKWKDLNYLLRTAGYRTVPVELGKKYDNDDWSQGMFRFGEFLNEFMTTESTGSQPGYLAQHDLFDQIPQLRKDFSVPKYCAVGLNEPVIKSWIGPANTISTMHTDDKHNLLCQVMGEKLIILASPKEAENLYLYDGLLNNTCQIDPENLNIEEFPLTQNVKFYKLVLKAGEMLYLPKLWFHYVRSLTKSISLSFWFDVEEKASS